MKNTNEIMGIIKLGSKATACLLALLAAGSSFAQGSEGGPRARITCQVSIDDYGKDVQERNLVRGDLSFDLMDARAQTKTFEAKYQAQEILFRVDAVNLMSLDLKTLNLRVFDNKAAGKQDDFKTNLKHELASTLVVLPALLSADAQAYLNVKVPGTDAVAASFVCVGQE